MKQEKTLNETIETAVYDYLNEKFHNFVFHVHFFTHGEHIETNVPNEPCYTFLLRKDKGAKKFKAEYDAKFSEIRIPLEYENEKYTIRVMLDCVKEATQ